MDFYMLYFFIIFFVLFHVMDAMKLINCEQIHVKVWFIRLTMYTDSIKSVETDQFDRSIRWLQISICRRR